MRGPRGASKRGGQKGGQAAGVDARPAPDPDIIDTVVDPSVPRYPDLPRFNTSVVGSTGLRQYGGFLSEEFLRQLTGETGRRTLREMSDNDPIIGGILFALTTMFRSVDWHVQAAEDPERAKREAKKMADKKAKSMAEQQAAMQAAAPPPDQVDPISGQVKPGIPKVAAPPGQDPRLAQGANGGPPLDDEIEEEEPPTPCEEGAAFLEEILDDMEFPIEAVMAEIASMFVYGFAPHEILWKRRIGPDEKDPAKRSRHDDGKIGLRGLPLRKQQSIYRWDIDNATGTILGVWQQPFSGGQVYIPIDKMLLFRTSEEGNNPEGRSILRNAYRPWYFKRRLEEIEAIGVERDLAGLPVASIPSKYMAADADPADRALYETYKRLVSNIRRDTNDGLVIPSNVDPSGNKLFSIELMNTGGSRSIQTDPILMRYAKEIATSVLADFLFLGQGKTGSFALSDNKTDMFKQSVTAFLQTVAGEFNRKLIPAIWSLNDLPEDTMPKLVPGDVEKGNLDATGQFLSAMASAGAALFPDEELENHLRKQAGWPPVPEPGMDERSDPSKPPAGAMPPMPGEEDPNAAPPQYGWGAED